MRRWGKQGLVALWLGTGAAALAGLALALIWFWPLGEGPQGLRTDRGVEESLLDTALAEIDQPVLQERFTGDLDGLIQRRVIRVLTTYGNTNFFIEDGRPRGFEYEMLQHYRDYLKSRVRKRSWPVIFLFIPLPFDQLLPALIEGRGDIAAAGLTITPQREKTVAFTKPYMQGIKEIVVTAEDIAGLDKVEDLSGRRVYVNLGTSYAQSLKALNFDLAKAGLAPVEIVPADPRLATADILDLVNAGIIELTIADSHIAELAAKTLPKIVLRPDLAVRSGGRIAWAVRKENPELLRSLNEVIPKNAKGTLIGNILFENYFRNPTWSGNPLTGEGAERLAELAPIFQDYAERYGFDWLQIAALAYQESRLDHGAKSERGAVGIMQILPGTAKGEPVGIPDISRAEDNIHAGVKYLAHLRDHYFNDPKIGLAARSDFALAAYNAGPTRISKLRKRALKEGFDDNVWFSNVEQIARRVIGRETVDYVANVNKHYVAYKLSLAALSDRLRSRAAIEDGGAPALPAVETGATVPTVSTP